MAASPSGRPAMPACLFSCFAAAWKPQQPAAILTTRLNYLEIESL